ncbi:HisA/HisF-related TIM barrel protein [Planctomicrobium sp. SH664]|uniref:HisA/HisF-related TIM barrel protein n=1 Tax=Planctomicrobium sp. SH664 TaxID=3448125 RepID=UPI003F5AF1CB
MELVPVVDLQRGQVVRGMAGERDLYRPNRSRLLNSSEPLATAAALVKQYEPGSLYVADLDGIEQGEVQSELLADLASLPVELVVDAGVETLAKAQKLFEMGVARVAIALETLPDLDLVCQFTREFGEERILFSLDMRDGQPIGECAAGMQSIEVVSRVVECGVHHLIVLDLAGIGKNRGVPTVAFCHSLKRRWPEMILWTGGGVRSLADIHTLSLARLDGAMVASALHDGGITPSDWRGFQSLSDDDILRAIDA